MDLISPLLPSFMHAHEYKFHEQLRIQLNMLASQQKKKVSNEIRWREYLL